MTKPESLDRPEIKKVQEHLTAGSQGPAAEQACGDSLEHLSLLTPSCEAGGNWIGARWRRAHMS